MLFIVFSLLTITSLSHYKLYEKMHKAIKDELTNTQSLGLTTESGNEWNENTGIDG